MLLFHLIFIGLAFFSCPVQALGIIVVVLSIAAMCIFSLALLCFACFHNKCVSIWILFFSLFCGVTYGVTLFSLVYVTEFFDYTYDFADNTVTSISMTFLSVVITAGPPFILGEQYKHLCKIIERLSHKRKEEKKRKRTI